MAITHFNLSCEGLASILECVQGCPLKWLDLSGNSIGGRGFLPMTKKMPAEVDWLFLASNRLRNPDLR